MFNSKIIMGLLGMILLLGCNKKNRDENKSPDKKSKSNKVSSIMKNSVKKDTNKRSVKPLAYVDMKENKSAPLPIKKVEKIKPPAKNEKKNTKKNAKNAKKNAKIKKSSKSTVKKGTVIITKGKAPYTLLKYQFQKPGTTNQYKIFMDMSMTMEMNKAPGKNVTIPTMIMTIETKNNEILKNGSLKYSFNTVDVDILESSKIPKASLESSRKKLKKLIGYSGLVEMSPFGEIIGSSYKIPSGVDLKTRQTMTQFQNQIDRMVVPFPKTPVGVGAKWKATKTVVFNNIPMKNHYVYELKAISGNKITMGVTITTKGKASKLNNPQLPPGYTQTVEKLNGTGSGSISLSFKNLMPIGLISAFTRVVSLLKSSKGGKSMLIDLKLNLKTTTKLAK